MKKGQAAMEFLMVYGWAILVVLAAFASLVYFGVFDGEPELKRITPEQNATLNRLLLDERQKLQEQRELDCLSNIAKMNIQSGDDWYQPTVQINLTDYTHTLAVISFTFAQTSGGEYYKFPNLNHKFSKEKFTYFERKSCEQPLPSWKELL